MTVLAVFLSYTVYQIQIVRHAEYLEKANDQHVQTVTEYPERGDITDRNGTLLATTTYLSNRRCDAGRRPAVGPDRGAG